MREVLQAPHQASSAFHSLDGRLYGAGASASEALLWLHTQWLCITVGMAVVSEMVSPLAASDARRITSFSLQD